VKLRNFVFKITYGEGETKEVEIRELTGERAETRIRQSIPHLRNITLVRGDRKQLNLFSEDMD
jgi:hypothetical protein